MIHLVNPLWDDTGGAERRTVETWRILHRVTPTRLWTEYEPAAALAAGLPVERIRPWRLVFPRGGTLVFIGVYFRVGHWIRLARPDRVVLVYNTDQPDRLRKNMARIGACGRFPEVVYTSPGLRRRHGGYGPILESPVDMLRFKVMRRDRRRPFTVGRLSRDTPEKHHREDAALYRALAQEGCRIRIMGGTCLRTELQGMANIELLPAGAEDPVTFLASLDCFVYRTAHDWFESFGRVVFEALATGLPVVCSRHGGYADYLVHARDALLFDTTEEALESIRAIRNDAELACHLGNTGRRTAERMHGPALERRTRELLAPFATRMPARSRTLPAHAHAFDGGLDPGPFPVTRS